jgi:hypothetical protein
MAEGEDMVKGIGQHSPSGPVHTNPFLNPSWEKAHAFFHTSSL